MGQTGSEGNGHLLQQVDALIRQYGLTHFHDRERLDAAFLKFNTVFDHAIGTMTAYYQPADKKQQGNRVIYSLAELKEERSHL